MGCSAFVHFTKIWKKAVSAPGNFFERAHKKAVRNLVGI